MGDKIDNDVVLVLNCFLYWTETCKNTTIIGQCTSIGSGTMIIVPCNVGSEVVIEQVL